MVAGVSCGLFNGLIVTIGKIEPFIATLGTMGIFRALITYMTDGGTIPIDRACAMLSAGLFRRRCGMPIPILISIAVTLGASLHVLYKTQYGRRCVAVGRE